MRTSALLLLTFCFHQSIFAQLNVTQVGNLDYDVGVNDVWGYVAPDGTEYALIGLNTGVSVVSLADPASPTEVGKTTGATSIWRDMKTYGEFAYAVADQGGDGLTVIDLRELPERISWEHRRYDVPGFNEQFIRAHNIYIDTEKGLAFTSGGDRDVNDGGMLIFDLKENPAAPELIAQGPETYSHDVFVRDTLMFASEIYVGQMAIYSIADLDSIVEVGRTTTPFQFTHNAWSTEDNRTVFTTDERGNASVAAYDISDLQDIQLLDEYRPAVSLNTGAIPHNVHVIDQYLSISSYTDGLRVVDASAPDNLVEVANFDTWTGPDGGFNGAWGAYPYLPSGLTLVSDRSTGLYVLDVTYGRASRINGTVVAADSNDPINGAAVRILTEQENVALTDAVGAYSSGVAAEGELTVVASALGYYDDTITVNLTNGETVAQDFALAVRPQFSIALDVRDQLTDEPLDNIHFNLYSSAENYFGTPDTAGTTRIPDVFDYDYDVLVTVWGYQAAVLEGVNGSELDQRIVYLDRGYQDVFSTDLGWTEEGNARRGRWDRGTPSATFNRNGPGQPGEDAPGDFGNDTYVTDLRGGNSNSRDVDQGFTTLISPYMDLTTFTDGLRLEYSYWFSNLDGNQAPNDTLRVSIRNADTTVVLTEYTISTPFWQRDTILLDGLIELTDSMQLLVRAEDQRSSDNLVEAAFDNFRILDSALISPVRFVPEPVVLDWEVFPNPSPNAVQITYEHASERAEVTVFSVAGQELSRTQLAGSSGSLRIGQRLRPGVYFLRLQLFDGRSQTKRWIKQK